MQAELTKRTGAKGASAATNIRVKPESQGPVTLAVTSSSLKDGAKNKSPEGAGTDNPVCLSSGDEEEEEDMYS